MSNINSNDKGQESILPTLTDDMFVRETPSFIVPYIYEKPSTEPLRAFINKLGKELEDQKLKEKENNKDDSNTSNESINNKTPKKKRDKTVRRRRREDDDDSSWNGESSMDSDDDTLSDEEAVVIVKNKMDSYEYVKQASGMANNTDGIEQSKQYQAHAKSPLGSFFEDIGLNLVQEYVQVDLLKSQYKKLHKQQRFGRGTKDIENSIASLSKNLKTTKAKNKTLKLKYIRCKNCNFKTESQLVMEQHNETPHVKNNMYKCNFCPYEVRKPLDILHHVETEHKLTAKLPKEPANHQCPNCPFEDTVKAKLVRHQTTCAKKFKEEFNLAPPLDWDPPAKNKVSTHTMKPPAPKKKMVTSKKTETVPRVTSALSVPRAPSALSVPSAPSALSVHRARSALSVPGAPSTLSVPRAPSALSAPSSLTAPSTSQLNSTPNNLSRSEPRKFQQTLLPFTTLPRSQPAIPPDMRMSSFVICEICDAFIKDRKQLGSHMQWIHSIKINEDRLKYNRPPICCQKCLEVGNGQKPEIRFYTDQGLERHLLGKHGLVSNALQEAALKGNDRGRCPMCRKQCHIKFLHHIRFAHNITLKPTNLAYKCNECDILFSTYLQFEKHAIAKHYTGNKNVA